MGLSYNILLLTFSTDSFNFFSADLNRIVFSKTINNRTNLSDKTFLKNLPIYKEEIGHNMTTAIQRLFKILSPMDDLSNEQTYF